jgi:hypothetical protein
MLNTCERRPGAVLCQYGIAGILIEIEEIKFL